MLFYLHIPKCGGTTAMQMFNQFTKRKLPWIKVWDPQFGADVHPTHFDKYDVNKVNEAVGIAGHLKYREFLSNSAALKIRDRGEVTIISIVRDPIEAHISLYNYMKNNPKHPMYKKMQSMNENWFLYTRNIQFDFLKSSESVSDIDDEIDKIFNMMIIIPIDRSEKIFPIIFSKITGFNCIDRIPKQNITRMNGSDQLITYDELKKNKNIYQRMLKNCAVDKKIYDRAINQFNLQ